MKIFEKYGIEFKCEKIDPEMCEGCLKAEDDGYCSCYEKPSAWARRGGCPMKTTKEIQTKQTKGKKMNPLKASKRKYRK